MTRRTLEAELDTINDGGHAERIEQLEAFLQRRIDAYPLGPGTALDNLKQLVEVELLIQQARAWSTMRVQDLPPMFSGVPG